MGSVPSATPHPSEDEDKQMASYLKGLPAKHLEPLWSQMNNMVPPSPNPTAKAHMWKYDEVLPDLQAAGRMVPEEKAERRVLMLVNPSMGK